MKLILNKIASINERYGVCLFYAALMLVLFSVKWFWLDDCADWIKSISMHTDKLAMWLCLLRILLLAPRAPWYAASCGIIIALANISCHFAADTHLYNAFVLMLASRDANIRTILRIFLAAFVLVIIIAIWLYFCNLASDISKNKFEIRGHSWGLNNPNLLAFTLSIIIMGTLTYLKIEKTWILWVTCIAAGILILWLTAGITSAVILMIFPILYYTNNKLRPSANIVAALPCTGLLLSIILALYFGPTWGTSTFDCRFSIPAIVWRDWGLSLMGQNCISPLTPGWEKQPDLIILDNVFLRMPLLYGFIPAMIGFGLWSLTLWQMARRKEWHLLTLAICIMTSGFMEKFPMLALVNPTLFYIKSAPTEPIHIWRKAFFGLCGLIGLFLVGLYNPLISSQAKSESLTISSIAPKDGFIRTKQGDNYSEYLRSLPLAPITEQVQFYNGETADSIAQFCHRVIDIPLLSESEQCADVCLYLRADFLYRQHRFSDIHFEDTQHNVMRYYWMGLRRPFEDYMQNVFGWANTESMKNEMPTRSLEDIQVGDVWIYDAKSRPEARYGHAILVADVAKNPMTGEIAILLLQGSTPACSIHILNNTISPADSPWFIIDQQADTLDFGMAKYHRDDLYRFAN